MANRTVMAIVKLTNWELLAIEVLLQRAEKSGGFESRSLADLIKKIAETKIKT